MDAFGDYEVWEYNLGPHQINPGEVDGEIDFEAAAEENDDEFPTSVDEIDDEDDE
jgi:hypothetical protein